MYKIFEDDQIPDVEKLLIKYGKKWKNKIRRNPMVESLGQSPSDRQSISDTCQKILEELENDTQE